MNSYKKEKEMEKQYQNDKMLHIQAMGSLIPLVDTLKSFMTKFKMILASISKNKYNIGYIILLYAFINKNRDIFLNEPTMKDFTNQLVKNSLGFINLVQEICNMKPIPEYLKELCLEQIDTFIKYSQPFL